MNNTINPFLELLEIYKESVYTKNVDAFIAIYEEDLHVFDMWGKWNIRGIDAWRKMAVEWFESLGEERVVVSVEEAQTIETGELALGHAILTYTAISPDGTKLRSLSNRISAGLRKKEGSWKIFHEHTSAPIDHQSMKAILQRNAGG